MWNNTCELTSVILIDGLPSYNKREVFCSPKSVTSTEYYNSSDLGRRIALILKIKAIDYEKEEYVFFENELYEIERTYSSKNEDIELHLIKINVDFEYEISFIHYIESSGAIKKKTEVIDYSCNAALKDLNSNEFNSSGAEWQENKVIFRVPYDAFTKNLRLNTKKYYIKINGDVYNIISALDYKNKHLWIDIKAILKI